MSEITTTWEGETLEFDFPAVSIGVACYPAGPTGCTVIRFEKAMPVAVDRRGGAVGFIGDYSVVDAICLAGGSLLGLEAATGVAAAISEQRGHARDFMGMPLVSGGIIFDFPLRNPEPYPDKVLGVAAANAVRTGVFPIGRAGAGTWARVGKGFEYDGAEFSGQGAAFRQVNDSKVAVFTVVNSMGPIHDRSGRVVRGLLDRESNTHKSYLEELERRLDEGLPLAPPPEGNTTLTVLVTNQLLGPHALTQLGRQVHASMARVIQPFHTMDDGDVLWSVSTGEIPWGEGLPVTALGLIASEVAWDAVLSAAGAG
jgi:L-aminopeptidase/D-esterase-like protein